VRKSQGGNLVETPTGQDTQWLVIKCQYSIGRTTSFKKRGNIKLRRRVDSEKEEGRRSLQSLLK
jgi:hypothetical protein